VNQNVPIAPTERWCSTLTFLHETDAIHFQSGYENRRINVRLPAAYFGVSFSSLLVQGVLGLGLPVPLSVST
jgi:hypothetical protein